MSTAAAADAITSLFAKPLSADTHAPNAAAVGLPTAVRVFKNNPKGQTMAKTQSSIRMAVGKGLGIDPWPEAFFFNAGHDVNDVRQILIHKNQCTDCKGSGRIMLFSSDAPCDRCLEQGFYFEGVYEQP